MHRFLPDDISLLGALSSLKDYSYEDIVAINTTGNFIDGLKFRLYEYSVYLRNVEYFPTLIAIIFLGYIIYKALGFFLRRKEIDANIVTASAVVYLLMALILLWRPQGLFPKG